MTAAEKITSKYPQASSIKKISHEFQLIFFIHPVICSHMLLGYDVHFYLNFKVDALIWNRICFHTSQKSEAFLLDLNSIACKIIELESHDWFLSDPFREILILELPLTGSAWLEGCSIDFILFSHFLCYLVSVRFFTVSR